MTTAEILKKGQVIKQENDCQLVATTEGFYMLSKKTGKHFVREGEHNTRVQLHWEGFIKNQNR